MPGKSPLFALAAGSVLRNDITVSVVIATYNRPQYLAEALESLLRQTLAPAEIIVVDDASTVETAAVVVGFGERVRYLRLAENSGKPIAVNAGIALARGSHLLIFDDDDVALPDALQSHVDFLYAHPEVDFTYSSKFISDADPDIWQRQHWVSTDVPSWPAREFFVRHAMQMQVHMQGMLIPKRCFEAVGVFDPQLLRSQDDEMVLRLAHRYRAANIDRPTFVLRQHAGLRGPRRVQHKASKRAAVWLHYGREIYRNVRERYPLEAYLPHLPGTKVRVAGDAEEGRALLQRGAIMLRHGLTTEAVLDMKHAFRLLRRTEPADPRMGQLLSSAFDVDAWELARPFSCVFQLKVLPKTQRPAEAIPAIARGVYWALRRALRNRRWVDAARSIWMLVILEVPLLGVMNPLALVQAFQP